MKKIAHFSFLLALFTVVAVGCQKEATPAKSLAPKVALGEHDYLDIHYPMADNGRELLPGNFSNGDNSQNPLTNEGALLGRVLFYDKNLSQNNLISCGSCHIQSRGFADKVQFSKGVEFGRTTRNSMALSNLAFLRTYFWDSRANDLEEQVMMPVQNHLEMGIEKLEKLPPKLAAVDYYPGLFEAAFGDAEITEERIRFALAQFLRSMVSGNSKIRPGRRSGFSDFSALEKMGKDLFMNWDSKAGCAKCHGSVLFSGWSNHNIGLDASPEDNHGVFKVPSLRNVAVTAPYMHDGRFQTLEEVIEHYDHGVQMNPYLSWGLMDYNGPQLLNLTALEKEAIIAFLNTLTDEQYLTDPKFSDPFK